MKDMAAENEQLRKRNGMLLIQVSELERKMEEIERTSQMSHLEF